MKASELVQELRKLLRDHGDLDVLCDCGSIHASLSSVGLSATTEDAGIGFVLYQREGGAARPIQPEAAHAIHKR